MLFPLEIVHVKLGTMLIETVLSGDSLFINFHLKENSEKTNFISPKSKKTPTKSPGLLGLRIKKTGKNL